MFIPLLQSWLWQLENCSKYVVTTQHVTPFVMMRITSEFLLVTWNWVSATLYEAFMFPNMIFTLCSILHVGLWCALIKVHLAVSGNSFENCAGSKAVLFFLIVHFLVVFFVFFILDIVSKHILRNCIVLTRRVLGNYAVRRTWFILNRVARTAQQTPRSFVVPVDDRDLRQEDTWVKKVQRSESRGRISVECSIGFATANWGTAWTLSAPRLWTAPVSSGAFFRLDGHYLSTSFVVVTDCNGFSRVLVSRWPKCW